MAKLLGSYKSNLPSFIYDELVTMVKDAVVAGDYGGGSLFDRTKLEEIITQGTDFTQLPLATAGLRANANSVNNPVSLLNARYNAITSETNDFLNTISNLLSTLEKDTNLAEKLLRISQLDVWANLQQTLVKSDKYSIDLVANTGPVAAIIPNTDPLTKVSNNNKCQEVCFSYCGDPNRADTTITSAITASTNTRTLKPVSLLWHYSKDTASDVEVNTGTDWSKISFIHPNPIIEFSTPTVTTISPEGARSGEYFRISGTQNTDNLPVYIRTLLVARKRVITVEAVENLVLSQFKINRNEVYLYTDTGIFYQEGVDYKIDNLNRIQPKSSLLNKTVNILFQEYYPAYQCSINEATWSPIILFDKDSPYTDAENLFFSLNIVDNKFPVVDETTKHVGLYIEMIKIPDYEFVLQVQPSLVVHSASRVATLEIEFERMYITNGITLNSVSNFPLKVTRIYDALSYGGQITKSIYVSNVEDALVLDKPITIRFPKQEIQRLFIEFQQENYTYKEHIVNSNDKLKKELLRATLPEDINNSGDLIRKVTGVQYEMTLQDISLLDLSFNIPTVITFGPYTYSGTPEVIKLNTSHTGTCEFYFIDIPYDTNNNTVTSTYVLMDTNNSHGIPITNNLPIIYRPPEQELSKVDFYIKVVFRETESLLEKFVLQVK